MSDNYSHDFDVSNPNEQEVNPLLIVADIIELAASHAMRYGSIAEAGLWCIVTLNSRYLSVTVINEEVRRSIEKQEGAITSENVSRCDALEISFVDIENTKALSEAYDKLKKLLGGVK